VTTFRAIVDAIPARPATVRVLGFIAIWITLSGSAAGDLLPGIVAALAATWTSLRLLPPGAARLQPRALAEFALRFLLRSILAGADVARRALDPRLPLRPGFVRYPVGLPVGARRNTFTTLMSLLPGTLPLGADEGGALVIHCLDIGQPVAAQLATEEAMLVRAIAPPSGDG
jgi:multicomponent Na+:H+ antiporter subunit E